MSEDPFWQQAEFMVARGYVPEGTDVGKIAEKLRNANAKNKDKLTVTNTRKSVYGEEADKIEEMMGDKAPIEKKLLRPFESAANKRELDDL